MQGEDAVVVLPFAVVGGGIHIAAIVVVGSAAVLVVVLGKVSVDVIEINRM